VVYSGHYLGADVLGRGQTEEEAWHVAASTTEPGRSQAKLNFKDWLATQAEREGSAEQRKQRIEEWKEAVAGLFAQVIHWLASDDDLRVLTVETGTTQKDEAGLGRYEISALRIHLASRFVEFVPVSRNIVGTVGPQGDMGFRAEGRVDMRSRNGKFMLFRLGTSDGQRWIILDDVEYLPKDLTKESFETALQELLE